jgi:hypothetical protein
MSGTTANANDITGPCWSFAAVSRAFTDGGTLSPFAREPDGTPHPFASGVSFDLYQCYDDVTVVGCTPVLEGLQFVNDNDRILIRIANDYANNYYVGSNLSGYLQMVSTAGNDCAYSYGGQLNISAQTSDVFPKTGASNFAAQFGVLWYAYGSENPVMMLAYYAGGSAAASPVVGMFTVFTATNKMTPGNCRINIGTQPSGEFTPFDWSYDTTSMKLTGTGDTVHSSTANSAAFFSAVVSGEPYNSISFAPGAAPRPTFSTLKAPIEIVYYNYLPFTITLTWYAAPGGGSFTYTESCDPGITVDWCSGKYVYDSFTTSSIANGDNSGTIQNIFLAGNDNQLNLISANISLSSSSPPLPLGGAHPFLINPTCDIITSSTNTYTVDWTVSPVITLGSQTFYPNSDNNTTSANNMVFFVGNSNDAATVSTPAVNSYYICPLQFVILNTSATITIYYGGATQRQTIGPGLSATVYISSLADGLNFNFATDSANGNATPTPIYNYAVKTGQILINSSAINVACSPDCLLQSSVSTVPLTVKSNTTDWSLQYIITLQDTNFANVTIATELLPITISNCNGYYTNVSNSIINFTTNTTPSGAVTINPSDVDVTVPFVVYVTNISLPSFQLATAF